MKFLISLIFIASLFLVPFVLYRRIYFRPVSCILINPGVSVDVLSVMPKRKFFRENASGRNYSLAYVGSGLYAFYVNPAEVLGSDNIIDFSGVRFSGSVVLFSRNKLGRFNSVDLSKRTVFDIIKKFN